MFPSVEVGGCLVLVELGTNAGFQIIAEARDFLRQVSALYSTAAQCSTVRYQYSYFLK